MVKQKEREFLLRTGCINDAVHAGIQPDDCVVWKPAFGSYQNFSLCDHSCVIEINGRPTGGSYICDASAVFSKGALRTSFAPREKIVHWSKLVAVAQALARDIFFHHHFDRYCVEFEVPPSWAQAIRLELTDRNKKVECNRFGGSPEILPDCAAIIADCKEAGMVVNLTSPGRRFMKDPQFATDIAANPPNILAFSFDDLDPDELVRIAKMDLQSIKAEWRTVGGGHGQRQKAYEGIYAAKLMREMGVEVKILFNIVIHRGNISYVDDILAAVSEAVPGAFANPYPAQSFGNEEACWDVESLPALRAHVNKFIDGTLSGTPGVTRRLHYYVTLESAFRKYHKVPERICEFMSGISAWDSTARPGAYRYAQIGKYMEPHSGPAENLPTAGGHLGCFWNSRLGVEKYVDDYSVEELANMLTTGMVEHGRKLGHIRKTNIMPRLMFDVVATESGLPSDLVPTYLETRREYAGY